MDQSEGYGPTARERQAAIRAALVYFMMKDFRLEIGMVWLLTCFQVWASRLESV
jgi:hypothetical protein